MKALLFASAVAMLASGTVAIAKEKEDPRISAVLSCTEITQPEQRLQCFDSKMQAFRQAVFRWLCDRP